MRSLLSIAVLAFAIALPGCTVPTTYSKSVAVKKDAAGNILEIVETETVVQPGGQGYPVRFERLKGIQPAAGVSQEDDGRSAYEFRKSK